MQVASGQPHYILDPRPGDFDLREIAHSLSMLCRFNGHCRRFYSVAQHSVLVSRLVPEKWAIHGLLHDAAEAYIGDMIRPLKGHHSLSGFRTIEAAHEDAIWRQFGLEWDEDAWFYVGAADDLALAIEQRDVMARSVLLWLPLPDPTGHPRIHPKPPLEARVMFEQRCIELGLMTGNEVPLWHCPKCGRYEHNDDCIVAS